MNAKSAGNKSTKVLKTKKNNGMLITVGALIAIAVLVLGGVVWMAQRGGEANPISFGETADELIDITDTGVIVVGEENAPVLQVWEDFNCPACASFEGQYGEPLATAVEDGDLRVEYHNLDFQNRASASGEYSTRAIAAIQCVAAKDSLPVFFDVKNAYYANQPAGQGGDLSPRELADIAESAGANADSVECIGNVETNGGMEKAEETADNADRSIRDVAGSVSTPTVAFEGEVIDLADATWLNDILS
ncbi:MAG: DsbA family protein [Dietzia sp.]